MRLKEEYKVFSNRGVEALWGKNLCKEFGEVEGTTFLAFGRNLNMTDQFDNALYEGDYVSFTTEDNIEWSKDHNHFDESDGQLKIIGQLCFLDEKWFGMEIYSLTDGKMYKYIFPSTVKSEQFFSLYADLAKKLKEK